MINHTARLPDEVLFNIFSYTTTWKEIVQLGGVCKRWRKLAGDYQLWKKFKEIMIVSTIENKRWETFDLIHPMHLKPANILKIRDKFLYVLYQNYTFCCWDLQKRSISHSYQLKGYMTQIKMIKDRLFATGYHDLNVWNLQSGKLIKFYNTKDWDQYPVEVNQIQAWDNTLLISTSTRIVQMDLNSDEMSNLIVYEQAQTTALVYFKVFDGFLITHHQASSERDKDEIFIYNLAEKKVFIYAKNTKPEYDKMRGRIASCQAFRKGESSFLATMTSSVSYQLSSKIEVIDLKKEQIINSVDFDECDLGYGQSNLHFSYSKNQARLFSIYHDSQLVTPNFIDGFFGFNTTKDINTLVSWSLKDGPVRTLKFCEKKSRWLLSIQKVEQYGNYYFCHNMTHIHDRDPSHTYHDLPKNSLWVEKQQPDGSYGLEPVLQMPELKKPTTLMRKGIFADYILKGKDERIGIKVYDFAQIPLAESSRGLCTIL